MNLFMTTLANEIKALEEKLLHCDLRKDPQLVEELLADDFEELGSNGKVTARDEVVQWLATKDNALRWSITEFRIRQLTPDLVLAIYRARQKDRLNDAYQGSMRSSLWQRSGKAWKMIFHQGTRILRE
jgi:hypothetical protein